MEIWRDIDGYEELYQVSNLGNVRSLGNGKSNNCKEKILKCYKDTSGYPFVRLYKNGVSKSYKTHRLVASEFIPNPNNFPQVNHKDEIKTNNMVDNLEWCTCEYNINYGTRNKKISKPIYSVDKTTNEITFYQSINDAQRLTNINKSHISDCLKYKRKTAGGCKWYYYPKQIIKKTIEYLKEKKVV